LALWGCEGAADGGYDVCSAVSGTQGAGWRAVYEVCLRLMVLVALPAGFEDEFQQTCNADPELKRMATGRLCELEPGRCPAAGGSTASRPLGTQPAASLTALEVALSTWSYGAVHWTVAPSARESVESRIQTAWWPRPPMAAPEAGHPLPPCDEQRPALELWML